MMLDSWSQYNHQELLQKPTLVVTLTQYLSLPMVLKSLIESVETDVVTREVKLTFMTHTGRDIFNENLKLNNYYERVPKY